MSKLLLIISPIFLFSCTTISRITGNWEFMKKSCLEMNYTTSCNDYAEHLKFKGDKQGLRKELIVKSCELKSGRGCDLLEKFYNQFDAISLKEECTKESLVMCRQAAMTLFNRGEIKEGVLLLQERCKTSSNSELCRMSNRYKSQLAEIEQVEKEKEKITKMISNCSRGSSKTCVLIGNMFYQAGDLQIAIDFTNTACVQGNDTGCKLQSNYILQKNGSDLVREHKVANKNQLDLQQKMIDIENNRQFREALRGIGDSLRQPATINCKTNTRYNQFTKSYEAESNCR